MKFSRRLRLYLTGVFLGIIVVWFMLIRGRDRDMDGWLPEERVKTDLLSNPYAPSALAACQLSCLSIDTAAVSALIRNGKIDFKASETQAEPCKIYVVVGASDQTGYRGTFSTCDSVTRIISLSVGDRKCDC